MSESLFCLLSFCSEIENKSNEIETAIYIIFDQICNLANTYPNQFDYREELEILMFRILVRPLLSSTDENKSKPEDGKTEVVKQQPTQGKVKEPTIFRDMNISKPFKF